MTKSWFLEQPRWRQIALGLAAALLVLVLGWLARPVSGGVDWHVVYRPAALDALHGQTPYGVDYGARDETAGMSLYFLNPPWLLVVLMPLALLPPDLARGILIVLGAVGYAVGAWRLGASRWGVTLFLLSPPVLLGLYSGNIEWLVLLGFGLPPQIGLFFVLLKPQLASGVVLVWLVESWRAGGPHRVALDFGPVVAALALSLLIFGLWPSAPISSPTGQFWNASFWPLSVPFGLVLLVMALKERSVSKGIMASPCLSPYVSFNSWAIGLAGLLKNDLYLAAAVAGFYVMGLLRILTGG